MSTTEIESETQDHLSHLVENLEQMPRDMRIFSLCFRALYSDQAVGGYSDAVVKFRKIRDDTRQDAMLYVKCILPATTSFIRSVKEYFENFEALSYQEWYKTLPEILKDTRKHKDITQTVLGMYHDLLVPLKQRQDEAKTVMKEFVGLQSKYEKMCGEYEATANKKRKWANALLFVPAVNLIACPLLGKSVRENTALAVANKMDAEIHGSAALIVSETLIPALTNFINCLGKVAGFFQVLEQDLESFESRAEEGKQHHYKLMCKSARDIKFLCRKFYAALPDVRTDFEALPSQDTDQNYVDKWLEKTLADIRSQSIVEVLFKSSPGLKLKLPPPTQTLTDPKKDPREGVKQRGYKLPGMHTGTPPKLPPKVPPKPPRSRKF